MTGRITFTSKKDSNILAAALVFDLKSQITGRISTMIHEIVDAHLY